MSSEDFPSQARSAFFLNAIVRSLSHGEVPSHRRSAFPSISQELPPKSSLETQTKKVELPSQQILQPSNAQWCDRSGTVDTIDTYVPHCSSSRQQARGIDRQRSFCIWVVLSTQAPTLCQKPKGGSDSHGYATVDSSGNCTIWRLPRSL